MKRNEVFSWVILGTGILALGTSVVGRANDRTDLSDNEIASTQNSTGYSRSAIWQQRLEAMTDYNNGGSGEYTMIVEGSNPTGNNQ